MGLFLVIANRCRQFDEGGCKYGPYCNFMHIKKIGRSLARDLEKRFGKVRLFPSITQVDWFI
jgi:hypothetical protein